MTTNPLSNANGTCSQQQQPPPQIVSNHQQQHPSLPQQPIQSPQQINLVSGGGSGSGSHSNHSTGINHNQDSNLSTQSGGSHNSDKEVIELTPEKSRVTVERKRRKKGEEGAQSTAPPATKQTRLENSSKKINEYFKHQAQTHSSPSRYQHGSKSPTSSRQAYHYVYPPSPNNNHNPLASPPNQPLLPTGATAEYNAMMAPPPQRQNAQVVANQKPGIR